MGRIVNYRALSSLTGLSQITVKHYLWYLEKTFIGERVAPFTRRLIKEIVKSPVFYFLDTGLAHYARNDFYFQDFSTLGLAFQNMVYCQMKTFTEGKPLSIHYWRTKDNAEVDFVLDQGENVIPVEVKLQNFDRPKIPGGLTSFIAKYHPPAAYVINLNFQGEMETGSTKIVFLPYYQLQKIF